MPYIYRGLIRCTHCGLSITPEKHKGHIYYHCTQYNGKHGAKWLREEEITNQLSNVFKRMQMPDDILKDIANSLNQLHVDKIEFHNKHYNKLINQQQQITKMMDNLYLDKLKGRITESEYDKFYTSFYDEAAEIKSQLSKLEEAQDNYYITAKYILELVNEAHELFIGSEVEEKRQLIKLVLQNLRLEDDKLLWDAAKPFDAILNVADSQRWCAR